MKNSVVWTGGVVCALVAVVAASGWSVVRAQATPEVIRTVLLRQDIPGVPGYEAVSVRVELPVRGREGRHTHPGSVMVYVMEGAFTMEYEGKPTISYKAGESFFIEPGKIHEGINTGTTAAKAVATFVIEKGKTMTTPAK